MSDLEAVSNILKNSVAELPFNSEFNEQAYHCLLVEYT